MSLAAAAAEFAREAHRGQYRKYADEPYHLHTARVAEAVAGAGLDEAAVAAAWLHDVVEDCGVTLPELEARFGARVARLVDLASEPPAVPGGPNRAARKAAYRERLRRLQGQEAVDLHTLKAADCLDNVPGIRDHDPGFWRVYRREVAALAEVLTEAPPAWLAALRRELAG